MSREDLHAGAKLLSRAAGILPADSKQRLDLLPDLGEALQECGDFAHANAVLDEAIERAIARGDRRLEVRGRLERAYVGALADPEGAMTDALAMGEEASAAFSELGDEAGLARALLVVGQVQFWKGRFAAAQEALERALDFARRVGDGRVEARILAFVGAVVFHGPTPAEDALRYVETQLERARARDSRIEQGYVLENVARCKALLGRFDEARDHVREIAAIFEELGRATTVDSLMVLTESSALIEQQAGDASLAERTLREGYQRFDAMGERGFLSTIAGELAHVLYGQGRDDEAEHFARTSADAAASDDVMSQALWRTALAKVLARRGDLVEAERLARAALAIAGETDFIRLEASALLDLAEVMRLAERFEEAAAATREALHLFEQKGDVISAGKARALLDTLAVT